MVIKVHLKLTFFIIFIFLKNLAFSQDTKHLLSIIEKQKQIDSIFLCQKIFIHTDKETYYPKETIYLKAYILNSLNKTNSFSTNLHVEILNPDNKISLSRLLEIKNGYATGDFPVPDSLGEGEYILRAYTPFMKNFNFKNAFIKYFSIINSDKQFYSEAMMNRIKKLKTKRNKIYAEIYPEGRKILASVKNKVGVTVKNCFGSNIPAEITLISSNTVIKTLSCEEGMNYFYFTPDNDSKYKLKIKTKKRSKKIKLPNPGLNSYTLQLLEVSNEKIYLTAVNNISSLTKDEFKQTVNLVVRVEGKTLTGQTKLVKSNQTNFEFRKKYLPRGVISFILYDAGGNMLAQRYVYNNTETTFKLMAKPAYDNSFFSLITNDKKYQNSNVSVTITHNNTNLEKYYNDIKSYLNKRYILNVNPYISNSLPEGQRYIDIEMLTNKNKINIDTLNESEDIQGFEKGINISGYLTRKMLELPVNKKKVSLYILNQHNDRYFTTTNKKGKFSFENLNYRDSVDFMLKSYNNNNKKAYLIYLDKKDKITEPNIYVNNYKKSIKNLKIGRKQFNKTHKYIQRKDTIHKNSRSLHNDANQVIFFDEINIDGYADALSVIENHVIGISSKGMSALRGQSSFVNSSEPLYLLDDMPVDKSAISSISPHDIERVEILKSPVNTAIYGYRGANGVVAVYTKRGHFIITGKLSGKTLGYHTPLKFDNENIELSDKKSTTVYWNPNMITDFDGSLKFDVKLPKSDKSYKIIIQGISPHGVPIYAEKEFYVK